MNLIMYDWLDGVLNGKKGHITTNDVKDTDCVCVCVCGVRIRAKGNSSNFAARLRSKLKPKEVNMKSAHTPHRKYYVGIEVEKAARKFDQKHGFGICICTNILYLHVRTYEIYVHMENNRINRKAERAVRLYLNRSHMQMLFASNINSEKWFCPFTKWIQFIVAVENLSKVENLFRRRQTSKRVSEWVREWESEWVEVAFSRLRLRHKQEMRRKLWFMFLKVVCDDVEWVTEWVNKLLIHFDVVRTYVSGCLSSVSFSIFFYLFFRSTDNLFKWNRFVYHVSVQQISRYTQL